MKVICSALALVATMMLADTARAAPPTPGGHDAVVLCRTRSGTVKVRRACKPRETPVDAASLGLCSPSLGSPLGCGPDIPCPGEGTCVDGACACVALARCVDGLHWDPSPFVCACVPVARP